MTRDEFDAMLDSLCAKLAYMSEPNLGALEEVAAGMASGKSRDRFPIAQRILERAGDIQRPPDDASPLIRAVFAHGLGQDAIAQGWAPELLFELRRMRLWPNDYLISQCKTKAEPHVRRLAQLRDWFEAGRALSSDEEAFMQRRQSALEKCRQIAALGKLAEART
ncbi:hypothetical protein [Salipiger thiooxidans]|uniref:hypothetical protein n=1 Tax=Salipiger thiooxidans TaxID=282683 RepID=UPI001CD2F6F8|nr:hypothetical protein [Salipiger thiooxidans]MCA0848323.1 hypothetical protein [Salipiger thiooxidans]